MRLSPLQHIETMRYVSTSVSDRNEWELMTVSTANKKSGICLEASRFKTASMRKKIRKCSIYLISIQFQANDLLHFSHPTGSLQYSTNIPYYTPLNMWALSMKNNASHEAAH
jgi:hypothetical protein